MHQISKGRGPLYALSRTTSFPGSSLFLRKDPGRGWSRDPLKIDSLKVDFQSSHEAPRYSLRVPASN